jgi:hypothetical protein
MWNQIFRKVLLKTPAGVLNTDYSVNQDLAGLKCINGQPQDLLQTAVYSGLFPHVSNTDGHLSRWVHSASYCAPKVIDTIIEGQPGAESGSTTAPAGSPGGAPVTSGDGSVQIQSTGFTPSIPVNPTNPTQVNLQQNSTIPPQQ